jgi:3-methyladenine DNA glycosylase AlkD
MDLATRVEDADQALRGMADPVRREATQGYFPTRLEILGVSAPKMRSVLKGILADLKSRSPADVLEMARLLRNSGTHEARQMAFELLDRRKDARAMLKAEDLRELGNGNDNWASVDAFSVCVSGPAWREGQVTDEEVLRWAVSPDPWWRRTALVSTVALNLKSRGGTGDVPRTLQICQALAEDPHPMVAKGLSWALRSLVGVDRDAVESFLKEKGESVPSLVRREVRNKLKTGKKNPGQPRG